jgi:hypothetical protein
LLLLLLLRSPSSHVQASHIQASHIQASLAPVHKYGRAERENKKKKRKKVTSTASVKEHHS